MHSEIHADLMSRAKELAPWYHEIELFPGFVTPSNMTPCRPIWDNIRTVMDSIDYGGKSVLEVGAMDGLWAFEAEKRGAAKVVATDVYQNTCGIRKFNSFCLAKVALRSNAYLVAGLDVSQMEACRIATVLAPLGIGRFDIVQCFGVLYHLKDPMGAIHNLATLLDDGGVLLIETVVAKGVEQEMMRFNENASVYSDDTTFWAPSASCLRAICKREGLKIVSDHHVANGIPERQAFIVAR